MKYGDRVRVRKEPHIEFTITRQQFDSFGGEVEVRGARTGMIMKLAIYGREDELEVIG